VRVGRSGTIGRAVGTGLTGDHRCWKATGFGGSGAYAVGTFGTLVGTFGTFGTFVRFVRFVRSSFVLGDEKLPSVFRALLFVHAVAKIATRTNSVPKNSQIHSER
jgi:hypothetical protein